MKKIIFLPIGIICLVVILVFLIVLSCSKEQAQDPCQDKTLIRQLVMSGTPSQAFTYNDNCQVYEYIEPYSYKKFSYNSLYQLIKVEQAQSINPLSCVIGGADGGSFGDPRKAKITQYDVFEYSNSGNLYKRSNFYINNDIAQLISYQIFHYTNNLVDTIKIYNPNDIQNQFYAYTYDEKGNVIKESYFIIRDNQNERIYANEYEFDDKSNPYQVLSGDGTPGINTNKNNIIKQTSIYYNSDSEYRNSVSYTYDYNTLGNPVKINSNDVVYGE
jgi:hypothetical protein